MKNQEDVASELNEEFRQDVREPQVTPAAVPEVVVQRTSQVELERHRHVVIQTWALAVLATAAVLTLMYFAKPVLIVVMVSVLIAFALAPIVDFCERIMRLPKSVGAMIAVLLLMGFLYGATWVSYTRGVDFMQQLPK